MCEGCHDHDHGASALPANTLKVILLPDGRVRIDTGNFAGATHASAAAAIPALAKALGVTIEHSARIMQAYALTTAHASTATRTKL